MSPWQRRDEPFPLPLPFSYALPLAHWVQISGSDWLPGLLLSQGEVRLGEGAGLLTHFPTELGGGAWLSLVISFLSRFKVEPNLTT